MAQRREAFFKAEPVPPRIPDKPLLDATRVAPADKIEKVPLHHVNGDIGSEGGGIVAFAKTEKTIAAPRPSIGHHNPQVHELHFCVGFANIPNQVYRKSIKKGFEFTLMVVGESGLGKSTFINSLFFTDIFKKDERPKVKKAHIEETTVRMCENGVNLTLTLVNTPGFGDSVDNTNCWDPIVAFIDKKFSDYFNAETMIERSESIPDGRVHCCLYFIAPTGHGLKPLDIEFMKHVHNRVNIIPVIAKADTMTVEECTRFKETVMHEIKENGIHIYQFPDMDDDDDQFVEQRHMNERIPFAIIGSNHVEEVKGLMVRCRKYPWGIVEVENLHHNDFLALRDMIIRCHMIDLIEVTKYVHYENFRCRQMRLPQEQMLNSDLKKHPLVLMEEERTDYEINMEKKQKEMEQIFQQKVQERENKLKDIEREYLKRLDPLKLAIETLRKDNEQKRVELERDEKQFASQYPDFKRYNSTDSLKE